MTITLITVAFILFIVGLLFLFFGHTKNPIHDLLGFALVIVGFMIMYSQTP